MIDTLYVGDTEDKLRSLSLDTELLDIDSYKHCQTHHKHDLLECKSGNFHTSLADLEEMKILNEVCGIAKEIYYVKSDTWNTEEEKKWTEYCLLHWAQFKKVRNAEKIKCKVHRLKHHIQLHDSRKTDKPQLWVAGCSITAGAGVEKTDTWKSIVANELSLELTDLSDNGASIIWASDQICRSDIRKNDLVFWGLTNQKRFPYISDENELTHNKLSHITGSMENLRKHGLISAREMKMFVRILEGRGLSTLIYLNILAIKRAYNYCHEVGAKMVVLGLLSDVENSYTLYDVPVFKQLKHLADDWEDLGNDNLHPGPKQHKIYADTFLKYYKEFHKVSLPNKCDTDHG
jgi:hypothetical protein